MKISLKKSSFLMNGNSVKLISGIPFLKEKERENLEKRKQELWSLSDGITQGFIAQWLACKESARLAYKEGWSSTQTSNSLTFGTLMHNCLEDWYKAKKYDILTVLDNYKHEITNERLWTPEDEQMLQLNQGYLEALLPAYFKLYENKDVKRKYLAVEREFQNQWTGNIYLRGKIDIVYETNGEVWIMDHKTKYSFDDQMETKLSFDLQGMFYILNYWLETGVLVKGFVQNMIQRPRLRQGKDETLKHFIERVKGDVDESYFKRIQVTITKEEFDAWYVEFKAIMDEICGWAAGLLPNYKNPSACETKYGACRFLKVCGLKDFVGLYKRKQVYPELNGGII